MNDFTVQWRRETPGWLDAGTEWPKAQAIEVAKELIKIIGSANAVRVVSNRDGALVWDFWLMENGERIMDVFEECINCGYHDIDKGDGTFRYAFAGRFYLPFNKYKDDDMVIVCNVCNDNPDAPFE